MRTHIAKIIRVERWAKHARTIVLTAEGDEVTGYGDDWQVGAPIIVFFNDKRNKAQFVKDKDTAS